MHISEGILDTRIIVAGYAGAAGLTALALSKIKREDIPRIASLGAAFFVSSLIHFKVGLTSVHLTLIGLVAVVLGIQSTPALLVGLFFQAVMFQHGGLSTLGVNTIIFSLPALFVHLTFSVLALRVKNKNALSIAAGFLSACAVLFAAAMVMLVILLSGEELRGMAFIFSISHGALALVEGVITFLVVQQILRIKPQMLKSLRKQ